LPRRPAPARTVMPSRTPLPARLSGTLPPGFVADAASNGRGAGTCGLVSRPALTAVRERRTSLRDTAESFRAETPAVRPKGERGASRPHARDRRCGRDSARSLSTSGCAGGPAPPGPGSALSCWKCSRVGTRSTGRLAPGCRGKACAVRPRFCDGGSCLARSSTCRARRAGPVATIR